MKKISQKLLRICLPVFFLISISGSAFAQSAFTIPIISSQLIPSVDTTYMSDLEKKYVPEYWFADFDVTDSNVYEVRCSVGLIEGGAELLDRSFYNDSTGLFADSTALGISGNSWNTRLGIYTGLDEFHLKIEGVDNAGNVISTMSTSYP